MLLKELEFFSGVKRHVVAAVGGWRRFRPRAVDSEAGVPSEKGLARAPKPLYDAVPMSDLFPGPAPLLTVSELNRRVRELIEGEFDLLWIAG